VLGLIAPLVEFPAFFVIGRRGYGSLVMAVVSWEISYRYNILVRISGDLISQTSDLKRSSLEVCGSGIKA
jgi:hypothetical protein